MEVGALGFIFVIIAGLANEIPFVKLLVCIGDELRPPVLMEAGALGFIVFIITGLANEIPFCIRGVLFINVLLLGTDGGC